MPRRKLRDHKVLLGDAVLELPVLARVGYVQRRPDNRDGPTACLHRRLVCCRVNARSEAAHDDDVMPNKRSGKLRGSTHADFSRLTRADDRDAWPLVKQGLVASEKQLLRKVQPLKIVQGAED